MSGRPLLVFYAGTRKLAAFLGQSDGEDPKILRYSVLSQPDGFRGGLVVHLDEAAASLEKLAEKIVPQRGNADLDACVVLGNSKINSYSFSSCQYYPGAAKSVSAQDIRSVIEQTRSIATLPLTQSILQSVPESFLVNDMEGIRNPLGLEASRLGVSLRIFTMDFQDCRNLARAFEGAEIGVRGYWPKMLAVSEAVLSPEEKEEGAVVIDVTDEMIQAALWKGRQFADSMVLPSGARCLTAEIARKWELDLHDAEKVKERYGTLERSCHFGEELIPLLDRKGQGSHTIRRQEFHELFLGFARTWLGEVLDRVKTFASTQHLKHPHYVFTGGGIRIEGLLEFLLQEFHLDARLGLARRIEAPNELLIDPSMTAPLGMFRWVMTHGVENEKLTAPRGFFEKAVVSAKEWFCTYF